MGCNGNGGCEITPPAWYNARGGNGNTLGCVGVGALSQCNGIWTSDTAVISAAAPLGTLTFDTNTAFFTKYMPVGLRFSVVDDAGLNVAQGIDRVVGFAAIDYSGTTYKLDGNPTTCAAFSLYGEHALSLIELGEITSGGPNVTVDLSLLALTTADTFNVQAFMYGWSKRGGGYGGSSVQP